MFWKNSPEPPTLYVGSDVCESQIEQKWIKASNDFADREGAGDVRLYMIVCGDTFEEVKNLFMILHDKVNNAENAVACEHHASPSLDDNQCYFIKSVSNTSLLEREIDSLRRKADELEKELKKRGG